MNSEWTNDPSTATLLINKHGETVDKTDSFRWNVYLRGVFFDGAVLVDIWREKDGDDTYSITVMDTRRDDLPGLPDKEGLTFERALELAPQLAAERNNQWHNDQSQ